MLFEHARDGEYAQSVKKRYDAAVQRFLSELPGDRFYAELAFDVHDLRTAVVLTVAKSGESYSRVQRRGIYLWLRDRCGEYAAKMATCPLSAYEREYGRRAGQAGGEGGLDGAVLVKKGPTTGPWTYTGEQEKADSAGG